MMPPTRLAMVILLVAACGGCGSAGGAVRSTAAVPLPASDTAFAALVARVLATHGVFDGHNDLLARFLRPDGTFASAESYDIGGATAGQTDLGRLERGGVGAALLTVAAPDSTRRREGLRASTDLVRAIAARNADRMAVALSSSDIRAIRSSRRIAVLMALEGAGQLGASPAALREAHALGVRSIGLAWNATNDFADAATDSARYGGLSAAGRELVREANRLGVVVDLSHASDAAARVVLDLSAAPVIFSHSSARALAPSPRNVPDDILRRLPANGGVAMVTFVPYFTTAAHWRWYSDGEARWAELQRRHGGDTAAVRTAMQAWESKHPEPPVGLTDVADHIDHVRTIAGSAHVGLGSDFDGMSSTISGLEDAAGFPALLRELARRGWTEAELAGLAGGNALRVFERVEAAAARLRAAGH